MSFLPAYSVGQSNLWQWHGLAYICIVERVEAISPAEIESNHSPFEQKELDERLDNNFVANANFWVLSKGGSAS